MESESANQLAVAPQINIDEINIDDPTQSTGLRGRTPKTPKSVFPTLLGATTPTETSTVKGFSGGYPGFGCGVPAGPQRYAANLKTPEPGRCLHFRGQKGCQVLIPLCRIIFTVIVALASLSVIAYAYFRGQTLLHDNYYYIGFGLYGAVLFAHILMQALFASLEHRRMRLLAAEGEQKSIFDEKAGISTRDVRSMCDG